jgi:hypothetical protein
MMTPFPGPLDHQEEKTWDMVGHRLIYVDAANVKSPQRRLQPVEVVLSQLS